MPIVNLTDEHLDDLVGLVNRHIPSIPPGWELTPFQVRAILAHPVWDLHYPGGFDLPRTIVARSVVEAGRVRAAIQWQQIQTSAEHGANEIVVSWLVAEPDAAPALGLLLDELRACAAELGLGELHLSSRFEFGVGWFGIPVIWRHITDVLEQLGFEPEQQWLIMCADTSSWRPAPPLMYNEMRWAWEIDEAALEWSLKLYRHSALIGECQVWGIPHQLVGSPDTDAWAVLEWIEVTPEYQGQGFGRILLREQARFQAERGKTKLLLYTETDNTAARRLFTAAGFSAGPESWCFKQTQRATPRVENCQTMD